MLINLWIQARILYKEKVGIRKYKIDDAAHDTMNKVVLPNEHRHTHTHPHTPTQTHPHTHTHTRHYAKIYWVTLYKSIMAVHHSLAQEKERFVQSLQ